MLVCPKCKADNLLNAIFCRGCGERLDIENLKPDELINHKAERSAKLKRLANQFVGVILTVAIVGIIGGSLYPVPGRHSEEPSAQATSKLEGLRLKSRKTPAYTFTSAEASAVITKQFKSFSGNAGVPTPEQVTVTFLADNTVRLILSSKLKFLPLHVVLLVEPVVPARGELTLNIKSAKLGLIPLPAQLRPHLLNNFKVVAENTMGSAKSRIRSMTIRDGEAEFRK